MLAGGFHKAATIAPKMHDLLGPKGESPLYDALALPHAPCLSWLLSHRVAQHKQFLVTCDTRFPFLPLDVSAGHQLPKNVQLTSLLDLKLRV